MLICGCRLRIRARSKNSVRVSPGQSAVTLIPVPVGRPQLLSDFIQPVFIPRNEHQIEPVRGKNPGKFKPNAGRRPRDHCPFVHAGRSTQIR